MNPRQNLHAIAAELRTAASWLESVGAAVLLADEPILEPAGSGPRPQVSRPTEAAAVALADGDRGWLVPKQQRLLALASGMGSDARELVTLMGDVHGRLPRDSSRAVCVTEGCVRLAAVGRAGYCDACRMWLRREAKAAEAEGRDPATAVPAEVVQRRAGRGSRRDARETTPPPQL